MSASIGLSAPAGLPERLLAKLACPHCRQRLRAVPEAPAGQAPAAGAREHQPAENPDGATLPASIALQCTACGQRFPVQHGIPLLFSEERPADWTAAQRTLYDGVAAQYDEAIPAHVAAHYRAKRVRLVRELAPAGGAVLDVGCGTGTLAEAIRRAGYEVYGVDASTGMLAQMSARQGWPVAGFCERLPLASDAFDLAITVATLHHITDPERIAQTIAEMCRVTRPGGHVVVWDHNPANPYWPIMMRRMPQDTGEERLVPQEEVVEDLRAAGVVEIRARRSGLVPDFTPARWLRLAQGVEWLVERTPGLNVFCAHNVVVARKRR